MSPLPTNFEEYIKVIPHADRISTRIIPSTGQIPVQAGQTVIFQLPQASIVDVKSFKINFLGTTNGTAACTVGFPKFMASLIEKIDIICNGQNIQSIERYNHIYNIVRDYSSDYSKYTSKLDNNADPSVETVMAQNGEITKYNMHSSAGVDVVNQCTEFYCISDWIGILNDASILNTNLVGNFEIHIQFTANSALWRGSVLQAVRIGAPTYTLTEMYGWIDVLHLSNDQYIKAIDLKLSGQLPDDDSKISNQSINIPYKNYRSYLGALAANKVGTTRITESCHCLDKVMLTYLDADRLTVGDLQIGLGTNKVGVVDAVDEAAALLEHNLINTTLVNIPASLFNFEYLKSIKNPYLMNTSKYFRRNGVGLGYSVDKRSTGTVQWEINSQNQGNPTNLVETYNQTMQAFGLNTENFDKTGNPGMRDINSWERDYFVAAMSTSHIGDKSGAVIIGGIDTMATSLNISCKTTGGKVADALQNAQPLIITEFTSILRISKGRMISPLF